MDKRCCSWVRQVSRSEQRSALNAFSLVNRASQSLSAGGYCTSRGSAMGYEVRGGLERIIGRSCELVEEVRRKGGVGALWGLGRGEAGREARVSGLIWKGTCKLRTMWTWLSGDEDVGREEWYGAGEARKCCQLQSWRFFERAISGKAGQSCECAAADGEMAAAKDLAPTPTADAHSTPHLCRIRSFDVHKSPKNDFTGASGAVERGSCVGPSAARFGGQKRTCSKRCAESEQDERQPAQREIALKNSRHSTTTRALRPKRLQRRLFPAQNLPEKSRRNLTVEIAGLRFKLASFRSTKTWPKSPLFWVKEWMSEGVSDWVTEWMNEQTNERRKKRRNEKTKKRANEENGKNGPVCARLAVQPVSKAGQCSATSNQHGGGDSCPRQPPHPPSTRFAPNSSPAQLPSLHQARRRSLRHRATRLRCSATLGTTTSINDCQTILKPSPGLFKTPTNLAQCSVSLMNLWSLFNWPHKKHIEWHFGSLPNTLQQIHVTMNNIARLNS